jgi:hypothetical protein
MNSILRGGLIADGRGGDPFFIDDIEIVGDTITQVGYVSPDSDARNIDVSGLVIFLAVL